MARHAAASEKQSPVRIPIFRALWLANMTGNFGSMIQVVGASWMMVRLDPSPQMIAFVQASTALPIMLLSLWAGAVADNLDRRRVMLAAQCFMLLVSVTLAGFAWLGLLTPWLLLGFTFLVGCGAALHGPAWQASVGDLVPQAALPNAVALNSIGFNLARSAGPAVGGVIVATMGAATAFLANAVSYVGMIAVLARWRPDLPPRLLPRERLGSAMTAGLRYATLSPAILTVLIRGGAFGFAASVVPALMPLIARDLIGGGAFAYGFVLGAFGVGAVGGAMALGRLRRLVTSETLVRIAAAGMAAMTLVTAFSRHVSLTAPVLVGAGACWVMTVSTMNATIQISSPRWVVARMLALYQMMMFGALALGSSLFGHLAEVRGIDMALLVAAVLQAGFLLMALRHPLPSMTPANLDSYGLWNEPGTHVPVEARSGPVVVTIEYRIAPDDIVAFLTAMREWKRIRRRDGARGWTLLHDLGDPEIWVERYHVPTWLDYVRHNHRRTQADIANRAIINGLHRGAGAPKIQRMIESPTVALPSPPGQHIAPDPLEG